MTTFSVQAPARTRTESILPYALWTAQALLAILFLFAGAMKFVMSGDDLTKDSAFSVEFLRFIGVCEVLGAIGLILPGITGIRRGLTPLAASGLVVIMVGATVTNAAMGPAAAVFPLVVGIVAAGVAYGRRSWLSN